MNNLIILNIKCLEKFLNFSFFIENKYFEAHKPTKIKVIGFVK